MAVFKNITGIYVRELIIILTTLIVTAGILLLYEIFFQNPDYEFLAFAVLFIWFISAGVWYFLNARETIARSNDSKMIDLDDNETIILDGEAKLVGRFQTTIGTLYLTNKRLIFLNKKSTRMRVPIHQITSLNLSATDLSFKGTLSIELGDSVIKFNLDYSEDWLLLIKQQMI